MHLRTAIALAAAIGGCAAHAAADLVTIDFESLSQSEIFSGTGWDATATTDVLDTYAGSGVTFSAGVSGINIDNIFLPNNTGSNAIVNSIRIGGVDTVTPVFSLSAVGAGWSDVSFSYIALGMITYTAYDSTNTEIIAGVLNSAPLTWTDLSLSATGGGSIARIELSGAGADVLLDNLMYSNIPAPGAAALILAGIGGFGLRRVRR